MSIFLMIQLSKYSFLSSWQGICVQAQSFQEVLRSPAHLRVEMNHHGASKNVPAGTTESSVGIHARAVKTALRFKVPWGTARRISWMKIFCKEFEKSGSYIHEMFNNLFKLTEIYMAKSYHQIYIHYIFSTKKRAPMIEPKFKKRLWSYIAGIGAEQGYPVISAGGMADMYICL